MYVLSLSCHKLTDVVTLGHCLNCGQMIFNGCFGHYWLCEEMPHIDRIQMALDPQLPRPMSQTQFNDEGYHARLEDIPEDWRVHRSTTLVCIY